MKISEEEKLAEARAVERLMREADEVMYLMDNLHKTINLWSLAIGHENIKKIIVNEKGKEKRWVYSAVPRNSQNQQ